MSISIDVLRILFRYTIELENAIYQKSYSLYCLNFPNFELNCLKDTDIMHLII